MLILGNTFLVAAAVVSSISFLLVYFLTPKFICYLSNKGKLVSDYHKPGGALVPRPAGPVLLIAIIMSELFLYVLLQEMKILAIILTTIISFLVGYIDDVRVMPGW